MFKNFFFFQNSDENDASSPLSDFSRRKHRPGDKLSFQEAAIKVLAEQRSKGVHALTTRHIWDLIAVDGLVDTK